MTALSPRQMYLLDIACAAMLEAGGVMGVYLVGTAQEPRADRAPRDVDVRMILHNKAHDRLTKAIGVEGIAFMGIAYGQYLASLTGLPIDFQVQRLAEANHHHGGGVRNPLGVRSTLNYRGDAPPVSGMTADTDPALDGDRQQIQWLRENAEHLGWEIRTESPDSGSER